MTTSTRERALRGGRDHRNPRPASIGTGGRLRRNTHRRPLTSCAAGPLASRRALDGWRTIDGTTTGFVVMTLSFSDVVSAMFCWLGWTVTATLLRDIACFPFTCLDLNVSS